jgi:hypothetical protein
MHTRAWLSSKRRPQLRRLLHRARTGARGYFLARREDFGRHWARHCSSHRYLHHWRKSHRKRYLNAIKSIATHALFIRAGGFFLRLNSRKKHETVEAVLVLDAILFF